MIFLKESDKCCRIDKDYDSDIASLKKTSYSIK